MPLLTGVYSSFSSSPCGRCAPVLTPNALWSARGIGASGGSCWLKSRSVFQSRLNWLTMMIQLLILPVTVAVCQPSADPSPFRQSAVNESWTGVRAAGSDEAVMTSMALVQSRRQSDGPRSVGRTKRDIFHLYNMMSCTTQCDPLSYKGYGCYCGFLGSGLTVDAIDRYISTFTYVYRLRSSVLCAVSAERDIYRHNLLNRPQWFSLLDYWGLCVVCGNTISDRSADNYRELFLIIFRHWNFLLLPFFCLLIVILSRIIWVISQKNASNGLKTFVVVRRILRGVYFFCCFLEIVQERKHFHRRVHSFSLSLLFLFHLLRRPGEFRRRQRCCKKHDFCYGATPCRHQVIAAWLDRFQANVDYISFLLLCNVPRQSLIYFVPYKWKCNGGHPYCGNYLYLQRFRPYHSCTGLTRPTTL